MVYLTDYLLVPLFILTTCTGFELHIAGHMADHENWHNWAAFHTITGIFFLFLGVIHIITHWTWYKGLKKKELRKKRRPTTILSVLLILVSTTGIWLLTSIEGANTPIGFFHFVTGIMMSIMGILHVWKRRKFVAIGR